MITAAKQIGRAQTGILRALISLIAVAQMICSPCLAEAQNGGAESAYLTGQVDSFDGLDDDVQEMIGLSCTKTATGVVVKQVVHGSEAARQGLKAGDAILDAWLTGKQLNLSVRRDGRTFVARIDENRTAQLQKETARIDLSAQPHKLQAVMNAPISLEARKVSVLANYQVELLLDRSLSMRRPDCPGGLSRWDWCSYQAVSVAKAIQSYVPGGMTITRFATEFDVHEHAKPQDMINILGRHDFQLGTCLCEPLIDRFNAYLNNRRPGTKPLLIAIITDGVPWPRPEPRMVRNTLVKASQLLAPGEVTVVFFQIGGDDPRGRSYLMDLGNNLMDYGARYQYVRTVPFEQLEQVGLANALVDAVQSVRPSRRIGMH